MKNLIKRIINEIKKLSKLDFVRSITLVGSYPDYRINPRYKMVDLDVVIIVDELKWKKYKQILQVVSRIGKEFSNDFAIKIEKLICPIKRVNYRKKQIILHLIIFDVEGYKAYCDYSPLVAYSWQRYDPLYGKALREIRGIRKITFKDLVKSRLGIIHYIRQVKRQEITCLFYVRKGDRLHIKKKKIHLSNKGVIELMAHGVYHTLNNILKIVEERNVCYANPASRFFNRFPQLRKYKKFVNKLFTIKEKIRKGERIYLKDVKLLKEEFLSFFRDLLYFMHH